MNKCRKLSSSRKVNKYAAGGAAKVRQGVCSSKGTPKTHKKK